MPEKLIHKKTYKDGTALCINVWRAGHQELVYPNMAIFEAAKKRVEEQGAVPIVSGTYTTVPKI